jgi:hypothetical protein
MNSSPAASPARWLKFDSIMSRPKHILLITFLLVILSNKLFATGQYGDILIIGQDTVWITSNPLEKYFEKKGSRTIDNKELVSNCTALWRGYVATWRLDNNKLYLVRIQTDYCGDNPTDVTLTKEFGSNKVFANWFSEIIVRPKGKLVQYVHMGYGSIYEEEMFYEFESGVLKNTRSSKYVIKDRNRVSPDVDFLRDTLLKIILKSLDSKTRANFDSSSSCNISICFNQEGMISSIEAGYGCGYNWEPHNAMEKVIFEKAKIALKDFPRLMKVTHKQYEPPSIYLYFSGHCFKQPHDKGYGCKY